MIDYIDRFVHTQRVKNDQVKSSITSKTSPAFYSLVRCCPKLLFHFPSIVIILWFF